MEYLHLGNEISISMSSLIAIINLEREGAAGVKEYMDNAALDGQLTRVSRKNKQKSLLICEDRNYISPLSSLALYRRGQETPFVAITASEPSRE